MRVYVYGSVFFLSGHKAMLRWSLTVKLCQHFNFSTPVAVDLPVMLVVSLEISLYLRHLQLEVSLLECTLTLKRRS